MKFKLVGGKNDKFKLIGKDIVDFINNSNNDDIINNLITIIKNDKYCEKVLGEGISGKAVVPSVNKKMKVYVNNDKKIKLPIIVKYEKVKNDLEFNIIDNKLYISTKDSLLTEIIILSYTNQLWYNKKSLHIPFMLGYSLCEKNLLITERHGLKNNLELDQSKYFQESALWNDRKNEYHIVKTNVLSNLMKYIYHNIDKDYNIILPNDVKCNVIEFIDYLCISYLHTQLLFINNNISVTDTHLNNIFIHYLNKRSYISDQYIGDIEYIIYKYNDKMIKIKTFGILLKIGDLGTSIIQPKEDIIIVGQGYNIKDNYKIIDIMKRQNQVVLLFLYIMKNELTYDIFSKAIISKLFNIHPYNKIHYLRYTQPNDLLNDFLSIEEILDLYYEKYKINKLDNDNNNTFIQYDK